MSELIAALARGAVLSQDPIHGSCRAQILAFIEQGGLNGGRRRILKARGMEQLANGVAFLRAQGAGGRWLRARRRSHRGGRRPEQRPPSIEGRACDAEGIAGGLDAHGGTELDNGVHQGFRSGSGVAIGQPNSAATFLGTSMTIAAFLSCSVRRWLSRCSF